MGRGSDRWCPVTRWPNERADPPSQWAARRKPTDARPFLPRPPMRWVTYLSPQDGAERTGEVIAGKIHGLAQPTRLLDLLGDDGERLSEAGQRARRDPYEVIPYDDAKLLAPIPVPPSIRDFLAFEQHVKTIREGQGVGMSPDWYELPVFYFSNPAAVYGARDEIAISPGSDQFDYELEVAAVVGRVGSDLSPEEAEESIAG